MSVKNRDVIAVVEAAYALAPPEAWLAGIVEAARPLLDRGLGVAGFEYIVAPGEGMRTLRMLGSGVAPEVLAGIEAVNSAAPTEVIERTYRGRTGSGLATRLSGLGNAMARHPTWAAHLAGFGAVDYFAFNALLGPSGHGCNIGALYRRREPLPYAVRQRWDRVAAHLGAGLRLRDALEGAEPLDGAEAVLGPRGRVAHAEGEGRAKDAREVLRQMAVDIDRARGRMRREAPDEALDIWKGLTAGRWSLVDHFDRDGRRYLVAHKNDPGVVDPRALSLRERQVAWYAALGHANKLIAYELGLAPSTVAIHLRRAAAKLGVHARVELVTLVRALAM